MLICRLHLCIHLSCNCVLSVTQCVKFLALPRILCVHLKRFRSGQRYTRKLDCTVTFPESFDFSEIAREGFSKEFTQVLYLDLFSVCHFWTFWAFLSLWCKICFLTSRQSASTLYMQWWCTVAVRCVATTRRTSVIRWINSGTTLMTATCSRLVSAFLNSVFIIESINDTDQVICIEGWTLRY